MMTLKQARSVLNDIGIFFFEDGSIYGDPTSWESPSVEWHPWKPDNIELRGSWSLKEIEALCVCVNEARGK